MQDRTKGAPPRPAGLDGGLVQDLLGAALQDGLPGEIWLEHLIDRVEGRP